MFEVFVFRILNKAQHRVVKQRGSSAPNHSEAFQSYGLRRHEIEKIIDSDPCSLSALAALALQARSGRAAATSLGMDYKPSLLAVPRGVKNSERDTRFARVIYHSDPETLYGLAGIVQFEDRPMVAGGWCLVVVGWRLAIGDCWLVAAGGWVGGW